MKKVLLMSLALASGLAGYAQEEVDVTNLIKNAGFDQGLTFTDEGKPVGETTATGDVTDRSRFIKSDSGSIYAVPTDGKGVNIVGDLSWYGFVGNIEGWEIPAEYASTKPEWKYFGSVPYSVKAGYLAVGDNNGKPASSIDAPATKAPNDDTDDNTGFLYLRAGWTNACVYQQKVSLPCAKYRIEYWTINTNPNSTAEATDLSQVVCRKDVYKDDTGLSSTEWTKHEFEFTPTTDFTLQFGYKSANKSSNDNPWIIIDGIKLYKVGEASLAEQYQGDLSDLSDEFYELSGEYSDYSGLVGALDDMQENIETAMNGTTDEMVATIAEATALRDSVKMAIALIPSIEALNNKGTAAAEKAYPGLADFNAVLNKYDNIISNGTWQEIVAYKEELTAAYTTYMYSQVATPENPADYTFLVSNPLFVKEGSEPTIADGVFTYPEQDTFEAGKAPSVATSDGWTKSGTVTDGDQRLNYAQGRICWNAWKANADGKTVAVSNTISNLPNGYYMVSGDLITQADYVNDQHVFGTSSLTSSNSEALTAGLWDADNNAGTWTTLTTDKVLVHDGVITIGASGTLANQNQSGWFCATNFKLYYLGAATQEEISAALAAKAENANALVAAMHFGGDKAAATDSIAAYTTSGDIALLNAAIKLAEASEAKYEEINAEGKTIPTVATALTDGTYGEAEVIVKSAYENTLAYINNGTYNKVDSIITNLKAYVDNYVDAYNNAVDAMAALTSETAKGAIQGTIDDQKNYLTNSVANNATVKALAAYLASAVSAAQAQENYEANPNATDYTGMIVNAKGEATDGWNVTKGEGDGPVKSSQYLDGDSNRKYFDTWNSTAGKNNFYMDQVVTGLPNGTYTLAANVRTSAEGAFVFAANGTEVADTTWMEIPVQTYTYQDPATGLDTTVTATDKYGKIWEEAAAKLPTMTDKDPDYSTVQAIAAANNSVGRGWMKLEIPNLKVVDHTLTIGVTCDSTKTHKHSAITWFSAADFTLTLTAAGDNTGWNGPVTGINEIKNQALKADAIYNINGQRVANMGKQGLYIVVRNGKATKVLKK